MRYCFVYYVVISSYYAIRPYRTGAAAVSIKHPRVERVSLTFDLFVLLLFFPRKITITIVAYTNLVVVNDRIAVYIGSNSVDNVYNMYNMYIYWYI